MAEQYAKKNRTKNPMGEMDIPINVAGEADVATLRMMSVESKTAAEPAKSTAGVSIQDMAKQASVQSVPQDNPFPVAQKVVNIRIFDAGGQSYTESCATKDEAVDKAEQIIQQGYWVKMERQQRLLAPSFIRYVLVS